MSKELQDLIIGNFIARSDVYALQDQDGKWAPSRIPTAGLDYADWPVAPWSRDILQAHLDGVLTTGHYLLDKNSFVKLIAFDIDFAETGWCAVDYDKDGVPEHFIMKQLREEWLNRASIHRNWLKTKLRGIAHIIAASVVNNLEIPAAVAYSGAKGMHVYGFLPEPLPAADARIGANLVMSSLEHFQLTRGTFEWTDSREKDPENAFPMFTVEVFPKQDSVSDGGYGNLMRLPLGRNLKNPNDPCFFVDMRMPMSLLVPRDPIWSLSKTDPFAGDLTAEDLANVGR